MQHKNSQKKKNQKVAKLLLTFKLDVPATPRIIVTNIQENNQIYGLHTLYSYIGVNFHEGMTELWCGFIINCMKSRDLTTRKICANHYNKFSQGLRISYLPKSILVYITSIERRKLLFFYF